MKLLKFVPPVASVLSIVKVPPAAVMIGRLETKEMLSIATGGRFCTEPSFRHEKINLAVFATEAVPRNRAWNRKGNTLYRGPYKVPCSYRSGPAVNGFVIGLFEPVTPVAAKGVTAVGAIET